MYILYQSVSQTVCIQQSFSCTFFISQSNSLYSAVILTYSLYQSVSQSVFSSHSHVHSLSVSQSINQSVFCSHSHVHSLSVSQSVKPPVFSSYSHVHSVTVRQSINQSVFCSQSHVHSLSVSLSIILYSAVILMYISLSVSQSNRLYTAVILMFILYQSVRQTVCILQPFSCTFFISQSVSQSKSLYSAVILMYILYQSVSLYSAAAILNIIIYQLINLSVSQSVNQSIRLYSAAILKNNLFFNRPFNQSISKSIDQSVIYNQINNQMPPKEKYKNRKSGDRNKRKNKWDESLGQIFRTDLLNNISQIRLLTNNLENRPIGESVQSFIAFIQDFAFKTFGLNREAPTGLSNKRKQNKNWFNTECYEARREFNRARNKYVRNRNDNNKNNYIFKKQQYNRIKNKCKKQYARKEGLRVSKLAKSDPKKKNLAKCQPASLKKSQNPENITIHDIYNHLNNLYSGESMDTTPTNDTFFDNISDEYLDQNFTEIVVKNAVFSQTNGKSAGSDHLEIFKNSFDIIGPFLTALYNTVFHEDCYPESWREGIIVPIFKGGNFEPKNFRGITLNNIISKTYSKLPVTRLDRWSQMHTKIIDNQYGFQKGQIHS